MRMARLSDEASQHSLNPASQGILNLLSFGRNGSDFVCDWPTIARRGCRTFHSAVLSLSYGPFGPCTAIRMGRVVMKKLFALLIVLVGLFRLGLSLDGAEVKPVIVSIQSSDSGLVISASVPRGFRHVVLRSSPVVDEPLNHALASGPLSGAESQITFTIPESEGLQFLRVEAGTAVSVPESEYMGGDHFQVDEVASVEPELSSDEMVDHLLNRVAYGPSFADRSLVESIGIDAYVEGQLNPDPAADLENARLMSLERELFDDFRPFEDQPIIQAGEEWDYFKGTEAPPSNWREIDFDAAGWFKGPTGIGYGDDDDETVLGDMQRTDENPGYLSVFLRKRFRVENPEAFGHLAFQAMFDDGFVAYLNGREIARANMEGRFPRYNTASSGSVSDYPETFSAAVGEASDLLVPGWNVLAIQLHNTNLTSSDASMIPELYNREFLTEEVFSRIKGVEELQQLIHVRGALAKNQLQAVLAEFWENHFTTDFDKVAEHFEDLRDSNEERLIDDDQAEIEAAQVEFAEYQFFYDNALGNFGDLLLYSATSPSQLIYLDNVLNKVGEPNENYAREILELFAFGVDNRYTQDDIEQLSKCFTGWQVRKVRHDQRLSYPDSARRPPTLASVGSVENVLLDVGPGWKYFKGITEPSPEGRAPTTAWTELGFDDSSWLNGATSIGYGDGDDATTLRDMRRRGNQRGYSTVYLRRKFTLDAPSAENLFLAIDYDDGYIAYMNGVEFARSENMEGLGSPPRYNRTPRAAHEVDLGTEYVNLAEVQPLMKPAPEVNVLSVEIRNVEITSSDLSVHPRIVERMSVPGSIENSDPSGFWTFRFNPEDHDTDQKVIFEGTPHEMVIPEGREGIEGLRDATDVIDAMVGHPSTAEFISMKLINRFVSDQISLESYKRQSAPKPLIDLMDESIEAWFSTEPPGNVQTVMQTILDTERPGNAFWSRLAYRSKVKTPVEYINSMIRALDWSLDPEELPEVSEEMGMHLFTRDDPDGWSEYGFDWVSTGGLLERVNFVEKLADYNADRYLKDWDVRDFLTSHRLRSAEQIIDYFDELLVNGKMSQHTRDVLLRFSETTSSGRAAPFVSTRGDYEKRAGELIGLILAMPECHYQ